MRHSPSQPVQRAGGHESARCVAVRTQHRASTLLAYRAPTSLSPSCSSPALPWVAPTAVAHPRSVVTHNGRRHFGVSCARASEGAQLAFTKVGQRHPSGRAGEPGPSSFECPRPRVGFSDPVSWLASSDVGPPVRSRHHADAARRWGPQGLPDSLPAAAHDG